MYGSASATTRHSRQPWCPDVQHLGQPVPMPLRGLASRSRWLLSTCCSLETPWTSWQPLPLFQHRPGLQVQCWDRHCGLLCPLSKGAALGYPSSSAAQADGAVWDTVGRGGPAVHHPAHLSWPCCAPPLPAGALFQALGSWRALC